MAWSGNDDDDQLLWFALYGVIYVSFYFFTSPFVGNPELLTTWTPYVYLSMGLYGWLFAAAALHTPVQQLGLVESTIKQPISLLFPFFSVSFVILILLELLMALLLPRATFCFGMGWKSNNVTLIRSFANVLRNSAAISVACVALILHCDPAETNNGDALTYNRRACEQLFTSGRAQFVPASYRGAVVTWMVGMVLAITNFILERFSGIQMISFHWLSDPNDGDESDDEEHRHEKLPADHRMPMVPWYSMFLFDTAFQLLISLKVFLGRFDHRSLQRALYPRDEDYLFDHLAKRDSLWLDFMADCGDGFNSSYHIARLLAQPTLTVDCPAELLEPSSGAVSPSKKSRKPRHKRMTRRTFPRGEALVIGGDLAYPHPDPESYEKRLWRCFEYAMKPPADYDPREIATDKPFLPTGVKTLADYDGPTAFAIPGNHDWFDGLNTYTRYIAHRNWLGGWLLPQKTSHFCLKLPHNWWLFGLDLALENDINTEQFELFERLTKKYLGPQDRVIIVTHEPRWILDSYEETEKTEEKLSYLVDHVLKGRVVLRLAGDIHNYTRHSLLETRKPHAPLSSAATKAAPPKSAQTAPPPPPPATRPPGPPRRRPSLHSILSQRALSPTRKHFPHMYADEKKPSSSSPVAGTATSSHENVRSPSSRPGKLLRRQSTTNIVKLKPPAAHHLVVAGGGGAFLHPTHAPRMRSLQYKETTYKERASYPPAHVSQRYALLNVFGFRRINWRFDIVGGFGYFMLVVSMFPRCSVREIYTSATWLEVFGTFANHIHDVLAEMLTSSYVSITTAALMVVVLAAFADCTALWKKCATGLLVSLCHCIAASSILLVFECIFEIAIERGSLGHDGDYSLYRYFSASVPAFAVMDGVDVLGVGPLFGRFMKVCMTIFDVPEMVATHRIKICASPLGLAALSRAELWQYYLSLAPYFFVLATPVVGVVFGVYLYVALNVFGRHYNEAFSALRIASYKNFVRLRFHANGDLELFAFGVDKMPGKWVRDPNWSGGSSMKQENQLPAHKWVRPSYWQPKVTKVGNLFRIDFENPELDAHWNAGDRSNVHLIDRVLIPHVPTETASETTNHPEVSSTALGR